MLRGLRFAAMGAWLDIAAAFRRSRLGTLWRSLGLLSLILLVGLLFGAIFKENIRDVRGYILDLALGLLIWDFMASTLTQSAGAFSAEVPALRHARQPLAAISLRICLRNFVQLVQTAVLAVLLHLVVTGRLPAIDITLLPGLACIAGTTYAVSVLALIGSIRFRDLPQFVTWLSHLALFLTPILWPDHFLGRYFYLRDINPFYHFVELFRAPLQGQAPDSASWIVAIVLFLVGASLAWLAHHRFARRAVYWL